MLLGRSKEKRKLFQNWVEVVFGDVRNVALIFERCSRARLMRYLDEKNPEEVVLDRVLRSAGSARSSNEKFIDNAREAVPQLVRLFEFLILASVDQGATSDVKNRQSNLLLQLENLSEKTLYELSELRSILPWAVRGKFMSWPSVWLSESERADWSEFSQLSSGEQNIISTGAKLIAHAEPGCLIAIDEPEVSLNTSWQQHYTDLIRQSLSLASGSHVLIATHSPHLVSSLPLGEASVLLMERQGGELKTSTIDAEFEGWGAEAVLYQVLDIPSASSYKFQRELAAILLHIQEGGKDKSLLDDFLNKVNRLNFEGADALNEVFSSIGKYRESIE